MEEEARRKTPEGLTQIPSGFVFEYQNPVKCWQRREPDKRTVRSVTCRSPHFRVYSFSEPGPPGLLSAYTPLLDWPALFFRQGTSSFLREMKLIYSATGLRQTSPCFSIAAWFHTRLEGRPDPFPGQSDGLFEWEESVTVESGRFGLFRFVVFLFFN